MTAGRGAVPAAFTALPNRTSLTAGLATWPACGPDTPAAAPVPSSVVPAGKKQVYTPEQVPGAVLPSTESDG